MPINSSLHILGSVGRGGKNDTPDITAVQIRLNELMTHPRVNLVEDGLIGPKTIGMIRDFQRNVCAFRWPDGRVDPDAKTIRAMNDPASEDLWARRTTPPPSGGGGGGGSGGGETPKQGTDAVEAALEAIAATYGMSAAEEAVMQEVLSELWKSHSGKGNTYGESNITEEDLDGFILVSKYAFKVVQSGLGAAAAHLPILGGAAVVCSALGVALLTYGLVTALLRALEADERVYSAISLAYSMVFWSHQTRLPDRSLKALRMMEENGAIMHLAWPGLNEAWRKGKSDAYVARVRAVADISSKAGVDIVTTEKAMRAALRTMSTDKLMRVYFNQIADHMRKEGDVTVAAALEAMALPGKWKYGA